MELQWLETFAEVVHHGSITNAARSLGYTQSAVSRHVAALEADCGARLLDRLPRGVLPTQHGSVVLQHGEAILRRVRDARRDLVLLDEGGTGRVRLAAFPTAIAQLVPASIAAFRRDHPAVAVSVVEGTTPALLERLAAGDVDVAVVSAAPDRPIADEHVELTHLIDERLLVAVPVGHPLARRRTVRIRELADDPFVVGSATDEPALMRAQLRADFEPVVDIVVADWTGKLGCVAAGLGVALVPALAARAAPADVRLLRLHPDDAPVRQVFAATNRTRTPAPAVAAFVRRLRASARAISS